MNKKGFTLIELLAVIIILGILMIIAIPSVTKYISDSRKNAYIDTAKEIITGAKNIVNEGKLGMFDTDTTYYMPSKCVKIENGGEAESPYGKFTKAYVVVTYNGQGYSYYWTSVDETGQGIKNLTNYDELDIDDIESNLKDTDIKTTSAIDSKSKILVISDSDCQTMHEEQVDSSGSNPNDSNPNSLYNVIKNEALSNGYARQYNGEHKDSFTRNGSYNIYYYHSENSADETEIFNRNNVIFAGHCWQMLRTTDTGGVKIIYNGLPNNGVCDNNYSNDYIQKSSYNDNWDIAYVGYMYNPNTIVSNTYITSLSSGVVYGNNVTYSNGTYTLTNTSTTLDNTHRYSCNNSSTTCNSVRYYFKIYKSGNYGSYQYYTLTGGKTIETALNDMLYSDNVNTTDSNVKTIIENWYESNLTSYSNSIEEAIYCNNRTIRDLSGHNPNGSGYSVSFDDANTSLKCDRVTDEFSISNDKAKLKYSIALITIAEERLIYYIDEYDFSSVYSWVMGPSYFDGVAGFYPAGDVTNNEVIRPVISLVSGTLFSSGNGSKTAPYIIE